MNKKLRAQRDKTHQIEIDVFFCDVVAFEFDSQYYSSNATLIWTFKELDSHWIFKFGN